MENDWHKKSEEEQMELVIEAFKEKGVYVTRKNGYGDPSAPYWSASIGEKNAKVLKIK